MISLFFKVSENELVKIDGDFSGHVGKDASGYDGIQSDFGYGVRNLEGVKIFEMGPALDMTVCNTQLSCSLDNVIIFKCRTCLNLVVTNDEYKKVELNDINYEVDDQFYDLGDMLSAGGGTGASTTSCVRAGWKKILGTSVSSMKRSRNRLSGVGNRLGVANIVDAL